MNIRETQEERDHQKIAQVLLRFASPKPRTGAEKPPSVKTQRLQGCSAVRIGDPRKVDLWILQQHQRLQHIFHVVGHVTKSRITFIGSSFLGQSNQDSDKGRTEVLHRGKVNKQMTDSRFTQLPKSFVVAVSNIVVAKFHEGPRRGYDQDLATLFKTKNLLILTHLPLSNLEDSLFTIPAINCSGAGRRAGPCRASAPSEPNRSGDATEEQESSGPISSLCVTGFPGSDVFADHTELLCVFRESQEALRYTARKHPEN